MPVRRDSGSAGTTPGGFGADAVYRGDEGFAEAVAGFNSAALMNPDVVVQASSADDIRRAVERAGDLRLPVMVQATGHGYLYPVSSGVLISTSGMRGVDIDPQAGTATVEAGARWADVSAAATHHGLAGLSGSSSDVGVVGYCLGGGFPVLGRAYGFASDRICAADLVTGDGRLRHIDVDEPDLLWALRGGKANLGIVTSLTIELVHLRRVYAGGIYYPAASAPDVIRQFADWAPQLPPEAGTSLALLRLPSAPGVPEPLRDQFVVSVRFAYTGPAADGEALIAPMRAGSPAMFDQVDDMPYADIDMVHNDPREPMPFTEGGMLLREIPAAAADALIEAAGPDSGCTLLLVELRLMGGAFTAGPAPDAVSGRDAAFFASMIAQLGQTDLTTARAEIDRVREVLRPWATGGGAVNVNGPVEPGDAPLWPSDTSERLAALRNRYDRYGTIRSGHTV